MRQTHLLVILFFIIFIYAVSWHFLPKRDIPLLVVDKTVPEVNYREHRSIFWLLKHWRFTDKEGAFLRFDKDYVGYHPETGNRDKFGDDHLKDVRVLYLADTYGIYDYEKGLIDYELRLPYEYQYISLIYGGFGLDEAKIIKKFAQEKNHLLIGEHNIFGYPTYQNLESSRMIQNTFGVKYNGWLVRYYEELEDVAFWIKELYKKIYGLELDYTGPGLVLVREDVPSLGWQGDLVIFQAKDLVKQYPLLHNNKHNLLEGASTEVPYLYWIEILEPNEQAEVLSYYELPLSEEASKRLYIRGLSTHIPALVYYDVPGESSRVYFAGDFADQLPSILPASLTGSLAIQRILTHSPGIPPQYKFYYRWYAPVFKNLLENYKMTQE